VALWFQVLQVVGLILLSFWMVSGTTSSPCSGSFFFGEGGERVDFEADLEEVFG